MSKIKIASSRETQAVYQPHGPVIIVDDDPNILLTLKMLVSQNFPDKEVLATQEGQQGLEWINSTAPSFIITDLCLPDIDGIQIAIRSMIVHPKVPVVIISGVVKMDEYQASTLGLSEVSYLRKPFKPSEIISLMQAAFSMPADGQIKGMRLINLLQLVCEEVDCCHLEIICKKSRGVISIENKRVLFSATPINTGKEALFEMIEWEKIEVKIYYKKHTNRVNLDECIQSLLLEMCYHSDMKTLEANQ